MGRYQQYQNINLPDGGAPDGFTTQHNFEFAVLNGGAPPSGNFFLRFVAADNGMVYNTIGGGSAAGHEYQMVLCDDVIPLCVAFANEEFDTGPVLTTVQFDFIEGTFGGGLGSVVASVSQQVTFDSGFSIQLPIANPPTITAGSRIVVRASGMGGLAGLQCACSIRWRYPDA